jgi:hypothetical protein
MAAVASPSAPQRRVAGRATIFPNSHVSFKSQLGSRAQVGRKAGFVRPRAPTSATRDDGDGRTLERHQGSAEALERCSRATMKLTFG